MASFVVLADSFNGTKLNKSKWMLPRPGDSSFLGRTQLRLDEHPKLINGFARLRLDTFNPSNTSLLPGQVPSVLGSEIISKIKINLATGVKLKARVRVLDTTSNPMLPGIVNSFFGFSLDADGDGATPGPTHDELDFEFLTNDSLDAQNTGDPQKVLTNVFDDASFSEAGVGEFNPVNGLDLTKFNTFEILWKPDKVQWFVNGRLIRTERGTVPDEAMDIRFNTWAPAKENFHRHLIQRFNLRLMPEITKLLSMILIMCGLSDIA